MGWRERPFSSLAFPVRSYARGHTESSSPSPLLKLKLKPVTLSGLPNRTSA